MKAKHTPGPQRVEKIEDERLSDGFTYGVCDSRGHLIFTMSQKGENAKARANAMLYAAAPDLLSACRAMAKSIRDYVDMYTPGELTGGIVTAFNAIEDAIAKAEGEE